MKKILRFFGIVFIAVLMIFTVKADAAGKNVCQTLKENKIYKYNLDKKGKTETVKVAFSKKEYEENYQLLYDMETTVAVNGKEIYKKTLKRQGNDTNPVTVMVTDVNKKDKQMELFIIEADGAIGDVKAWTADMRHIYYYRYANGKVKRIQDIAPLFKKNFKNVKALHGMKNSSFLAITEKSELYAKLCVKTSNFGFSHLKVGLVFKNGKFKRISSKSYLLLDEKQPYQPKKNTAVYTKAGGTRRAFTIKRKQDIYLYEYVLKNKKVYLKVKNKNGKAGYIVPQKVSTYLTGTKHVGRM